MSDRQRINYATGHSKRFLLLVFGHPQTLIGRSLGASHESCGGFIRQFRMFEGEGSNDHLSAGRKEKRSWVISN